MAGLVAAAFFCMGVLEMVVNANLFGIKLDQGPVITALVLQALETLLLGIGGVLLIARIGAGRVLVVAGALVVLLQLAMALTKFTGFFGRPLLFTVGVLPDVVIGCLAAALLSAGLAVLPSTAAYIATRKTRQPVNPQTGYGPPQQW